MREIKTLETSENPFPGYESDPLAGLTQAERRELIGSLLAIDSQTGKRIATGRTIDELRQNVRDMHFTGDWRLTDGPTSEEPKLMKELQELSS